MATIIGKATRAASRLIIPDNAHLTREPPDIENVRRRTWCEQASWAVGPDYCCDCLHWNGAGGGKYAKSRKARRCQKFLDLTGHRGMRVPASAYGCHYFEMNPDRRRGKRCGIHSN